MGLDDIPTWLASAWNISEATAGVILSMVVIFAVLLPTMYLAKGRSGITIHLFVFFLAEISLVGIGWLDFWVLIATVAVMAIAIAALGADLVTGG